mmetsp:Transcript_4589/g.14619  ORF Transcript_4589/g.14619 Transcript_4589/m.14619 type:complete len:112 (-) Transcript_4589:1168-1503(-)
MDMYESKHDEIEPSSAAGSGACARAAASPPSLPPSPSPPCTAPGRDRHGTGNSGDCCENSCLEERDPTDPVYALYSLVVVCRSACRPMPPPSPLPPAPPALPPALPPPSEK